MNLKAKLIFLAGTVFFFVTFPHFSFANHIPSPTGFVNDFAGVLTREQKDQLEATLKNYNQTTTNEIAIALVKSLNGVDITDFTVRAFEEWKIGRAGKDNGVLFLAAIEDRKMRIEVGYGLEPYLTDSKSGDIIRNIIAPRFKEGDYYGGLTAGVLAIENQISPKAISSPPSSNNFSGAGQIKGILFFVIFIFFLLTYICAFLARSKSFWAGGVVGVVVGFVVLLLTSIVVGVLSMILLGLFGLILDWYLSKNYKRLQEKGHRTDWWGSGGGFLGGGGGGFGGFSGGSSGGGGANGGW